MNKDKNFKRNRPKYNNGRKNQSKAHTTPSPPVNHDIPLWINKDDEFVNKCEEIAKKFKPGQKTQLRKFYDKFNEACNIKNIFQIQLLRSQLCYQKNRSVIEQNIADFIEQLIKYIDDKEKIERAKLCFECVCGFYK